MADRMEPKMTYSTNWEHVVRRADQLMQRLQVFLAGQPVKKIIVVPGRLVNVVV